MRLFNLYFQHYRHFSLAIWLNIIVVFVNACGVMMSFFITFYLVKVQHYSVMQASWMLGLGSIGSIIGSYFGGWLADRCNHVRITQVMLLLAALQNFLIPWARTYQGLVFLIFLLNFCIYAFRPANTLILFAHCEHGDRTRVFALYRTAFNLGLAVAVVMGTWLVKMNFHYFFWFSGTMNLLSAAFLWYWMPVLIERQIQRVTEVSAGVVRRLHQYSNFFILTLLFLLATLILAQVRSAYGLYLNQYYNLSVQEIGYLFTINMIGIVLVEVPLMSYLKNKEPLYLAMIGSLLIALGMVILPFHGDRAVPVFSVILWTLGEILVASPSFVLAMRYADPQHVGLYMGFFQTAMTVGVVLAPLVGGALYFPYHAELLWYGCGILAIAIWIGFQRLLWKQKRGCAVTTAEAQT